MVLTILILAEKFMNIDGAVPESKLSYPKWILDYLTHVYPTIFDDLLLRRSPKWLKPQSYEDYFTDSMVQKLFLWAEPNFIQSSLQFIEHVHQIYRDDIPVLDLRHVFKQPVSSFLNILAREVVFVDVRA